MVVMVDGAQGVVHFPTDNVLGRDKKKRFVGLKKIKLRRSNDRLEMFTYAW
jgi:hypothetical protein